MIFLAISKAVSPILFLIDVALHSLTLASFFNIKVNRSLNEIFLREIRFKRL